MGSAREIVASIRADAGLSQRELASLSGVAQSNIAAYESGKRVPSEAMLQRLRQAARPRPSRALAMHRRQVEELGRKHKATDMLVFGSVARGQDHPGSDLDLLVTFGPTASLFDQIELAYDVEALLGVRVDIVSAAGLRSGHDHIRSQAQPL